MSRQDVFIIRALFAGIFREMLQLDNRMGGKPPISVERLVEANLPAEAIVERLVAKTILTRFGSRINLENRRNRYAAENPGQIAEVLQQSTFSRLFTFTK